MLQALFGSAASVFLARAGARFFSERVGWVAGVLLAIYPPSIFFDGILQKASIDLVLMCGLLWTLGAIQQQPRLRLVVLAGVLQGAMTLNRENAAVLVPVLMAWIVWLSWGELARLGTLRLAALAAGMALVLLPVGLRNYRVGGEFTLTTSQMGPNFYIGNHHGATGGYVTLRADRGDPRYESQDARLLAEDALGRKLSPGEVSQFWLERSWDYIKNEPMDWLRLLAKVVLHLERDRAGRCRGDSNARSALAAVGGAVGRAALWRDLPVGGARAVADAPRLAAIVAALCDARVVCRRGDAVLCVRPLSLSTRAGGNAVCRCGAAAAWELWWCTRRAAGRELAIGTAIGVLVAIVCNWPTPQTFNDDTVTYFNAGTTLLDEGRTEDAIALFEKARKIDPKFPATYINLGRAWLALNNLPRAHAAYEQAIKVDPNHAIFYLNLADVEEKEGRLEEAVGNLRQAIKLDPLLVPAMRSLARWEMQHGDVTGAVAHFRRGAELASGSAEAHLDLGMALVKQGDLSEAASELRRAQSR